MQLQSSLLAMTGNGTCEAIDLALHFSQVFTLHPFYGWFGALSLRRSGNEVWMFIYSDTSSNSITTKLRRHTDRVDIDQ